MHRIRSRIPKRGRRGRLPVSTTRRDSIFMMLVLRRTFIRLCGAVFVTSVPHVAGVTACSSSVSSSAPFAEQVTGSGLQGVTYTKVIGGLPTGNAESRRASVEFAVAPVENDKPLYSRAVVLKSDEQGNYKYSLRPGTYWIGPKEKAMDPVTYVPTSVSVAEQIAVVKESSFTTIDIFQVGYAP